MVNGKPIAAPIPLRFYLYRTTATDPTSGGRRTFYPKMFIVYSWTHVTLFDVAIRSISVGTGAYDLVLVLTGESDRGSTE